MKLSRYFTAFLFLAIFHNANISAQRSANVGIDVSDKSPVYFDMRTTTPEQRKQVNDAHHAQMLARDPQWDIKRAQYEQQVQQYVANARINPSAQTVITIPVVVHIVYNTQFQNSSDSCVFSQLVVLNEDFTRTAADTGDTPAPFAAIAGNPGIQFCLAQRDPNGNPTTGIERRQTSVTSFNSDAVKFYSSGGMDQWDPTRYFNIWVCNTGGVCWGEFPIATTTNTYGIVMNYTYFGSNYTSYGVFPQISNYFDYGEICVHEIGHCLNLYHIWGDDAGACTGTDNCPDTPNQADASSVCLVFPAFDACTPSGDGIMFENYMDYTDDDCLNLFTQGQCARMSAVLAAPPYDALVTSNGCTPVTLYNDDASINTIKVPAGNVCTTFTPVVVLKNWGLNSLTSCSISYFLDSNGPTVYNWNGNLASIDTMSISFPPISTTVGNHTFTAYTNLPNGNTDSQPGNDQQVNNLTVLGSGLALPYSQGFEFTTFVPALWTLNNSDNLNTWSRTTNAAKSGVASAMMDNINYYNGFGINDEMKMLSLDLTTVPNPSMAFDVAYTYYNQTSPPMIYTDTLTVLISVDCGQTFSVIYQKGGAQLSTSVPVPDGPAFIPLPDEWRTEYISLANYQTADNAIIIFRNTSGWGNQLYLDNINLDDALGMNSIDHNSSVNIYPNPATGQFFVDASFATEENLQIKVVDVLGKTVSTKNENNTMGGTYSIDVSELSSGIYFVEILTQEGMITKKIIVDKK
jgi:hypothetical protein